MLTSLTGLCLYLYESNRKQISSLPTFILLCAHIFPIFQYIFNYNVSYCMFTLYFQYFTFVVIIFIMEMVGGILAFVYREDIEHGINAELRKGISENYGTEEGLTAAWDSVQQKVSID